MVRMYYAHSLVDQPPEKWQTLEDHLQNVARLASRFASAFGAGDWGRVAGLWHDLGKYSEAFQRYISADEGNDYHVMEAALDSHTDESASRTDHTSAGAQYAVESINILGHLLAYPVAGHHAGLLDGIADGPCLDRRLKKQVEPWRHGLAGLQEAMPPELPRFLEKALAKRKEDPKGAAFGFAFFVRMLFSCLVDADFLDTERFMDAKRASFRSSWPPDILQRMEKALNRYIQTLPADDTPVNQERRKVREACLSAAKWEPGLFSLTVPTGGGKTLSSLAFALRHARLHGLERVIYVIPFTSIIEQNAEVFRRVFRPLLSEGVLDPVLEHHSAVDVGTETLQSRMAAENWYAPLVVTTSVQFYESLFANRTSRCRKLHNIARSVIILDEVQKIPVDYLSPCLLALRELAGNYGCSVVLCTATQPAVHRRENFSIGLDGVRKIVPDPRRLYLALKRVTVETIGKKADDELAGLLQENEQVLCIVNTRRHARDLFERLKDDEGAIHLSAAMCPEHRSRVLARIRRRLEAGEPCRVVSTQLVEAGVDVDFPVVYRSLAGLDAIAQAAGRCNRNGRLPSATTYVFESEHPRSEAFLRDTVNAATQILGTENSSPLYDDILSIEAIEHYFKIYFWAQEERWDKKGILDNLEIVSDQSLPFQFAFRAIAGAFRLIGGSGQSVIVPWSQEGKKLCAFLRHAKETVGSSLLRRMQRYTVQVGMRLFMQQQGRTIELIHDRYPVLMSPELHYDERLGLVLDREDFGSETFMI